MANDPRIAALAAAGITEMIRQFGGDPERVMNEVHLTAHDVGDPAALLDLKRYCALFEQAARGTGVDSFGMQYGRHYRIAAMGPLGQLALNAPTLGSALRQMCAFFPALQEHSALELRETGAMARLDYAIRDGRIGCRRQDAELSIAIFLNLFRHCLGANWQPERIDFEHARGADASEHRRWLGAPVLFLRPINSILFRRAVLAAPMPHAKGDGLARLRGDLAKQAARARPEDFVGRLTQEIRGGLAHDAADIESVAARMAVSRATLYRALAARGLEFSTLSRNLRQELALDYLAQPHLPVTEIAALVGYSELSAFSRAFTRWTGMAPAHYRAALG